ncbi:transcription and mRNA export factor ENY2-like [Oppia nitens]|uniref:transcription and mRNA export factor ENY2-like n=1 Tax=Oppia nitens TaxID=1686743 RepID=UPI0023DC65E7|nr:transcription and mRNA export factor ENY2-like [Oppia nitens]XP_054166303.1 transcription and mRNA export factor ENY2-like [Oppia nitens]
MSGDDKRLKAMANQSLTESGEKDRLIQLLRTRLLECGWRDQVVMQCKDVVRDVGVENITIDQLIQEVTPKARQSIPDSVKRELLQKIKTSLTNQLSANHK